MNLSNSYRLCTFLLTVTFLLADIPFPAYLAPGGHWGNPPVLVDPILCSQLSNLTELDEVDKFLLQLCRNKTLNVNRNFEETSTSIPPKNLKDTRAFKSRLPPARKKLIVDLHNTYRSQVSPPAADMKFMKWDDDLAGIAQEWANNCEFKHGRPENSSLNFGQNLYAGPDSIGDRAVFLWYDEYQYYDYDSDECEEDEQCGHYVQLAWANSDLVGCAVTRCPKHGFLFVCHYAPRGNHPDVRPYQVGVPCSQCRNRVEGGLCFNKTCVTQKECARFGLDCSCNLHCHNCGVRSPNQCHCVCKRGWDSLDCSKPCEDIDELCGKNPGWPDIMSCSTNENQVRDEYCRKMCQQCRGIDENDNLHNEKEYCCGGVTCVEGKILDNSTCKCVKLCPGPICLSPRIPDEDEDDEDRDEDEEEKENDDYDDDGKSYQIPGDEPTSQQRDDDDFILGSKSSASPIKSAFIYVILVVAIL